MNKQAIANAQMKAKLDQQATIDKVREFNFRMARALLTGRISSPVVHFAEMVVNSYEKDHLFKGKVKEEEIKK